MARLDFVCSRCGAEIRDRVAPAGTPPPICSHSTLLTFHGAELPLSSTEPPGEMEILWTESASTGFSQPITFEDDDGTVRSFNSPEEVHRFERQTEREVAEGRRPRPFVFRELSQDRSNFDRNVFQHLHPQVAREKMLQKRRGKPIITIGGVDITVHGDPNDPASGGFGGEE